MNTETYGMLDNYMLTCMDDSAHDKEHIYRVLYSALDIASYEENVDYDVLISACLLHDIGRKEEFENPELCHEAVGSEKAYDYLISKGFHQDYAEKVKDCIKNHRFRGGSVSMSLEAQILFDADKLDVTGAVGIARTLLYKGQVGEPLYSLTEQGNVSDGTDDKQPSFLQEYKYKLEDLYTKFHTKRATEVAAERKAAAKAFYESLLYEASSTYERGQKTLIDHLGGHKQ